ncbi:hypothetical protein R1flu_000483 [Riccia fluitans]|uniref:Uncharacterized protein n=1 Tax=Riccia fluitans TaxID=41844 RepID=A0ABD1Y0J6_9MARC
MESKDGDLVRPLLEEKQRHVIWAGFAKYLLVQECLEMIALRGLMTILGIFLLESLKLSQDSATEVVHVFFMGTLFSSIIGTLMSDGYMGKYRAVFLFSFCEFCGYIMLLVIASVQVDSWLSLEVRQNLTYVALSLVAVGFGGLRPCTATFGGDQAMRSVRMKIPGDYPGDVVTEQQKIASRQYFSVYYATMTVATVISAVIYPLVRVQGHGNYFYVFLLPACSMPLGTFSFWLGTKDYHFDPTVEVPDIRYGKQEQEYASLESGEKATNGSSEAEKRFLLAEKGNCKWDEWKILLSSLIVISPTAFFTALHYQISSTWVFQAREMDGHMAWLGGLEIPPDEIGAIKPVFVVLIIPIFSGLVYPFMEKHVMAMTNLRKMVVAMFLVTLSFVLTGALQVVIENDLQEKQVSGIDTSAYANISRLWQIPQYMVISIAEVMMLIPALEWSYLEAPKSMKTVVNAVHNIYQAVGNLFIIVIVALIGEKVAKSTQDFVFVGLGAFGTVLMVIFSHTYVSRESRALEMRGKRQDE